ncbi:ankyrin [Nadsonia fulvescens var. elongata DSM 6958]|uniref:Ankyrin n=1 Tax=Nadsonia fulvescens var. elongata DSM 6958 TaxID=857566 RepID=A0A1E3PPJ3_9ASCO|nr:ankyrin [Nadsonia fulvescens var. elongata DSM 6958]
MHDPGYRLRWAIINNQLSIVKRLLERFPDLLTNIDSSNGYSNLHYAASNGHHPICVYLVSKGHDKQEISLNFVRQTPLHLATASNHEQTVHFLCREFPHTIDGFKSTPDKYTPIILAAKLGHDPVLNILLDFDADINAVDNKGNRAVHYAAAGGFVRVLRTLADRQADFETSNYEGWKPFQYAATYKIEDWIKNYLVQKKQQQSSFSPRIAGGAISHYNNSSTSTVNSISTVNASDYRGLQNLQININKSLPYAPEVSDQSSPALAPRIGLGILAPPSTSTSTLKSTSTSQSLLMSPYSKGIDKDKDLPIPPVKEITSSLYNGTPQSHVYFIEEPSRSSSSVSTVASTVSSSNPLNNNLYNGFNNSNPSLVNTYSSPAGMAMNEFATPSTAVATGPASVSVTSLSSSPSPRKGSRLLPTVLANIQTSPQQVTSAPKNMGLSKGNNTNSIFLDSPIPPLSFPALGPKNSPKLSLKSHYSPAKPSLQQQYYPEQPVPRGALTPSRITQVNFPSVSSSSNFNDETDTTGAHKSKFLGIPIERISKPRRVSSDI